MEQHRGIASGTAYVFIIAIVIGVAGMGYVAAQNLTENSVEEAQIDANSFEVSRETSTSNDKRYRYSIVYESEQPLKPSDLQAIEITNNSGGSIMTAPRDGPNIDQVWDDGTLEKGDVIATNLTDVVNLDDRISIIQHRETGESTDKEPSTGEEGDSTTQGFSSGSASTTSDSTTSRLQDVTLGDNTPDNVGNVESGSEADDPETTDPSDPDPEPNDPDEDEDDEEEDDEDDEDDEGTDEESEVVINPY